MIPGGFETAITYEIAKKFKQWLLATGKKKYIKNTFDDYLLEYTYIHNYSEKATSIKAKKDLFLEVFDKAILGKFE